MEAKVSEVVMNEIPEEIKPIEIVEQAPKEETDAELELLIDPSKSTKTFETEELQIPKPPAFEPQPPPPPPPSPLPQFQVLPELKKDDTGVEKQELLFKLKRLEARGVPLSKHYSTSSSIYDLREEYARIKAQRDLESSIQFQRRCLMAFTSGAEFLNNKFDPFDIKLDGWSETVQSNLSDYDDVFEELHEKYKTRAQIAPELKLLMMLGGSGVMFHMTNTLLKSHIPNVDDILKENPDLAHQFADAATKSVSKEAPGIGNFMNDLIHVKEKEQEVPKKTEMTGPDDQDVERILSQIQEFKEAEQVASKSRSTRSKVSRKN